MTSMNAHQTSASTAQTVPAPAAIHTADGLLFVESWDDGIGPQINLRKSDGCQRFSLWLTLEQAASLRFHLDVLLMPGQP